MAQDPSRRSLLAGAAILPLTQTAARAQTSLLTDRAPDSATAFTETGALVLHKTGERWQASDLVLTTAVSAEGVVVSLLAPASKPMRIHLRWQVRMSTTLQFLGDQWERSYGDLGWRSMDPERLLPWYMLAFDGQSTVGWGVKTAPGAFCFWQVDPAGLSLWLDVRNGGRGVELGKRARSLATVVNRAYPDTKPFVAARQFCKVLSPQPRLLAQPVYGGNNWYYAYGKSSAQAILDDSDRIASLSPSTSIRPFMVIDDGWQPNPTAGPWSSGNRLFSDMAGLAGNMQKRSVRPGIWMRPLFTKATVPEGWLLQSPAAERTRSSGKGTTLDPTVPEAAASIAADMATAVGWGYELVKHDFSTYDLFGRWGFRMGAELTDPNWSFHNRSLTNAEIVRDFYTSLRQAAGSTLLLGCNTVGHLSAGLFEISRTGDDTSGRDWNRTRKMGVNTLAFRAPQQGAFYAVDADCVGITKDIPWKFNRQWLDLLARSGTPLFVSAAPESLGSEEREAVRRAFAHAAKAQPVIEPVDWLTNTQPEIWIAEGERLTYDWFGAEGASPLST